MPTLYFIASLFVARVVYLATEVYYNRALLDAAAVRFLSDDQFSVLEVSGHILAGVGGALLATGIAARWLSWRRAVVAGALAFPFVYWLSGALVDAAVSSATSQERFDAHYLSLFRGVLIDQRAAHSGLFPNGTADLAIDDKLVLASFPLLLHSDPGLVGRLRGELRDVVLTEARYRSVASDLPAKWADYRLANLQLLESWDRYRADPDSFSSPAGERAVAAYGHALTDAIRSYLRFLRARDAFLSALPNRLNASAVEKLRRHLVEYFRDPEKQRLNHYQIPLEDLLGATGAISRFRPQIWCDDSGCPGGTARIYTAARSMFAATFEEQARVPIDVDLERYLSLPAVADPIRDQLRERGVTDVAAQRFLRGDFSLVTGTPATIYDLANMTHNASVRPLLAPEQFVSEVWMPAARERLANIERETLPADAATFDRDHRAHGDSVIASLYVFPVAMSLSAAFALINLVALCISLPRYRGVAVGVVVALVFEASALSPHFSDRPELGRALATTSQSSPWLAAVIRPLFLIEPAVYLAGRGVHASLPSPVGEALDDALGLR